MEDFWVQVRYVLDFGIVRKMVFDEERAMQCAQHGLLQPLVSPDSNIILDLCCWKVHVPKFLHSFDTLEIVKSIQKSEQLSKRCETHVFSHGFPQVSRMGRVPSVESWLPAPGASATHGAPKPPADSVQLASTTEVLHC